MAAIAPTDAPAATVDEGLVQKFIEYTGVRPSGDAVTVDDIRDMIAANTSEPGGKEQLERMLAEPAPRTTMYQKSAKGKSSVQVLPTSLKFAFVLDEPIKDTPVKTFTGEGLYVQDIIKSAVDVKSTLYYDEPADLTKGVTKSIFIRQTGQEMVSVPTITVDVLAFDGQRAYSIVIEVTFPINNRPGSGIWN